MKRVLVPGVLGKGDRCRVSGGEHHYISRVRRARPGDEVEVTDDSGETRRARIESIGADETVILVEDELSRPGRVWPIRLGVAVPKRALFDGLVRQVSELGAVSVAPILTRRGVVEPGENKVERWRRIARESKRQCGRAEALAVEEPAELERWLVGLGETDGTRGTRWIWHPGGGGLGISRPIETPVTILIGPEGGWTAEELDLANRFGFEALALGTPVLRIETAAVAACAITAALLGALDI